MNELATSNKLLPDNLEDLSKYVLVGRERLNAVRAEIRAIEKVGLAKEVHEQKLQEAQEIAEAVLDAEVKIGELTKAMERAQGFASIHPTSGGNVKTKTEQLNELGINHYERYETLAKHPETVEKAKEDARAEGRIVTRADVLNRIATPKPKGVTFADISRIAKEEHKAFEDTKSETVVSIDEIKKDKQNTKILVLEIKSKILKSLSALNILIPDDDFEILNKECTKEELEDLRKSFLFTINGLELYLSKIGGKN